MAMSKKKIYFQLSHPDLLKRISLVEMKISQDYTTIHEKHKFKSTRVAGEKSNYPSGYDATRNLTVFYYRQENLFFLNHVAQE